MREPKVFILISNEFNRDTGHFDMCLSLNFCGQHVKLVPTPFWNKTDFNIILLLVIVEIEVCTFILEVNFTEKP